MKTEPTTAEIKLRELAGKNPPSNWLEKARARRLKESGINEHYQKSMKEINDSGTG